MGKNIFSKRAFFISLVVAMFLFSLTFVFAKLTAPTSTGPVYSMQTVDSNEDACKAITGNGIIDSTLNSCCGGNKLRSSSDPLCQAKSLCDGTVWHTTTDASQEGEVFRIPASAGLPNMPYPIVNINNGLVMCVDDLRYDAFRKERVGTATDPNVGCVPKSDNGIDKGNAGTPFEAQYLDYLCPPNYYYAGGNTIPGSAGLCREDHLVNEGKRLDDSKSGYLFCNGWYGNNNLAGMFGHAYLIAGAGRGFPFPDDTSITSTTERCPSAIGDSWIASGGSPLSEVTVIPCPGNTQVTAKTGDYVGPFGGSDAKVAGVCLPKFSDPKKPVYDIFFNNLNYVRGKLTVSPTGAVTILGTVKGKQYLCDTTNRAVPAAAGSSNAKIHICCGSGGCDDITAKKDPLYTVMHKPGESISYNETDSKKVTISNFKLFCRSDGKWSLDLDNDSNACTSASNGIWTGKYCCSEGGDDSALRSGTKYFESYVDEGGKGACVNSYYKPNNVNLDGNRVIVSNGMLLGCSGDMYRTNDDGYSLNSGNFKISTPTSLPGTSSDSAYSPEFTKSLVVWNGASTGVYGQFVMQDGTSSSTPFSISNVAANSVRVSYSPSSKKFLVVFGDSSGLKGVFVSDTGTTSSVINIVSGSSCFLGEGNSYGSIAYSQTYNRFVVSCTKGSATSGDVVIAFVDADSTVFAPVKVGTGSKSSVSVGGNFALVTWSSASSRFAKLVDLRNVALGADQTISGGGWIYSGFNTDSNNFDLVYGDTSTVFKRSLTQAGVLSSETSFKTLNISALDVGFISSRNAFYFVFPSSNFVGGLSITELSSSNVLAKPFDVADVNYSGNVRFPIASTDPSISSLAGSPLILMTRKNNGATNKELYAQVGGLGSMIAINWPNSGNGDIKQMKGYLVNYSDTCSKTAVSSSQFFCDVDSTWKYSSVDKSHFSFVPPELMSYFKTLKANFSKPNMQCCAENQCWDPNKNACINPQLGANEYYNLSNGNVYKCINGVWGNPNGGFKFTPDACKKGFCATSTQCLYNPNGQVSQNGNTVGNPQCINSGQFIGDDACINGVWSSRTALAANTLLRLKPNLDYTLVCSDSSKDVLVAAATQNSGNVKNTYCVLEIAPGTSNNQRIIAVALSQDLEIPTDPSNVGSDYIYALKQSFLLSYPLAKFNSTCVVVDGFAQPCAKGQGSDGTSLLKLYYNSTSKIAVFSDKDISGLKLSWQETVCSWLPNWLSWLCPSPQAYSNTISDATFDQFYSSKMGSTEVLGISKERCECVGCSKSQTYVFDYKGYSVSDVQNVIGTPDLYTANEFTIVKGLNGVESSKVTIKNPSNVNKDNLWKTLVSVRK